MLKESLNLVLAAVLGIAYVFFYIKIIDNFLKSFASKKNNALLIIFVGSVISSGVNLYHVSELCSSSFHFYYNNNNVLMAVGSYLIFFCSMFVFSFVFFRVSFFITAGLTKENESAELAKNNIEIASIHAITIIILSFVIAPALVSFASQFIPYPKMPF